MANTSELPEAKETADIGTQGVARVYAEALYETASKRGQVDAVLQEAESLLQDVFQNDSRLEILFSSAAIGRYARQDALKKAFQGRSSETFYSFLQVLNSHERLELIRPIARALRNLYEDRARRVRVYVTSAVAMDEDQVRRIGELIQGALKLEPVVVPTVDPSILGGIIIRVGDKQFDASVRTRIENLRNKILVSSSHEIQSRRDRFCSANGN